MMFKKIYTMHIRPTEHYVKKQRQAGKGGKGATRMVSDPPSLASQETIPILQQPSRKTERETDLTLTYKTD